MIKKINFGSTGHLSSRIIFGGAAFWDVKYEEVEKHLSYLINMV